MSCEPAAAPEWANPPSTPLSRGPGAWLALGAISLLLAVYVLTLVRVANPKVDEAYRRTFITREFAIYPKSPIYGGRDGLTYELGRRVDLADGNSRWHLGRYEFYRFDKVTPFLKGFRGRVYFHLPAQARQPDKAHRLAMQITCRFDDKPATQMTVSVNDIPMGQVACANGAAAFETVLPPGLIGARDYDKIEISRVPRDLADRLETRFATAYGRIAWDWFEVDLVKP